MLAALLACAAVVAGYVAVIYGASFVASPRHWWDRQRNVVVRARILGISLYTAALLALFPISAASLARPSAIEVVRAAVLMAPLMAANVILHFEVDVSPLILFRRGHAAILRDLAVEVLVNEPIAAIRQGHHHYLRDVIIGPLMEEAVFRHVIMAILGRAMPASQSASLYAAGLFAVAHGHPLLVDRSDAAAVAVQLAFTFLFGAYAGRLYERTAGSLSTCFLVHAMCNRIGLPDLALVADRSAAYPLCTPAHPART